MQPAISRNLLHSLTKGRSSDSSFLALSAFPVSQWHEFPNKENSTLTAAGPYENHTHFPIILWRIQAPSAIKL